MKKILILSFAYLGLNLPSKAQAPKGEEQGFAVKPVTLGKTVNGWTEVSNGLLMRKWKDGKKPKPDMGDFITIHSTARVGDSILFSSRVVNNNEPFEIQVRPAQQPRYDLMEGFMLLGEGDSVTFRMPLDTILKQGAPELPWMKKGTSMWFDQDIVVVGHKKQAAAFKEKAEKARKLMHDDSASIVKYLKEKNIVGYKRHPSGVFYKINKVGTGDSIVPGNEVTVNYTGKTIDGKVFDSNTDSAFNHVQPFTFEIGKGQVIAGWDIGVGILKKGSKATLYIPSPMAYGERSPSPSIPKNAILIFDVEVTNVLAAKPASNEGHNNHDGHNH